MSKLLDIIMFLFLIISISIIIWFNLSNDKQNLEEKMIMKWRPAENTIIIKSPSTETTICINDLCRQTKNWIRDDQ